METEILFAKNILASLSEESGVSGYEQGLEPRIRTIFQPLVNEIFQDTFGNIYLIKKGKFEQSSVMLAAHMDEIGLVVTDIDSRGFLHFIPVGGIDERTLLYQEVIVHGKEDILGIICSKPRGLISEDEKNKPVSIRQMGIDVGLSLEEVRKVIKPGDIVSIKRKIIELMNNIVSGKSIDDRVGLAVLAVCLNELKKLKHNYNVYAVATVQEEVGLRGAVTSTYRLKPDLAVAVDVTHAQTPDTKKVNIKLGQGPVISVGPNIFPKIFDQLCNCAKTNRIPYQVQPVPGPTGTDARAIQLTNSGIPTGLLSIPLRYMHTSVETIALQDIVNSGKLLAYFISSLPDDLEELVCY